VATVDLVYSPDCPNVPLARTNLMLAFARAGVKPHWSEHRIGDPDAPGHTRGHMSVVLRLPEREFLVAGDAAFTLRAITESVLPINLVDEHEYRRSLREIQLYRRETPQAVIVPGHDMGVWSELNELYE